MSAIKMGWGLRIGILYGGFVILIATLVTLSMKQDFQLVSRDYYQKELKYQEVIDAGKNQAALTAPALVNVQQSQVQILLPEEFRGKSVTGSVEFYAAANAQWDKKLPISTSDNTILIPRADLQPTSYTVKMSWEAEGKKYYQENKINLHHE